MLRKFLKSACRAEGVGSRNAKGDCATVSATFCTTVGFSITSIGILHRMHRSPKETSFYRMPGGSIEPRFTLAMRGDKVALKDQYKNWHFVLHYIGKHPGGTVDSVEYSWIAANVLADCRNMEGTP